MLKGNKIYTKGGDRGKTSLCNGKRIFKHRAIFETIGSLDELNSFLGLIRAAAGLEKINHNLRLIQRDIMTISSKLAGFRKEKKLILQPVDLEELIDKILTELPPLAGFLVPGENLVESYLQIGRAVCRRAERNLVHISRQQKIPAVFLAYLNRLSDLLFALAYWAREKL